MWFGVSAVGKPIFALPGNPVSAMVTAIAFIKPAIRAWLGYPAPKLWTLPLLAPTPPNTARRHFDLAACADGKGFLVADIDGHWRGDPERGLLAGRVVADPAVDPDDERVGNSTNRVPAKSAS